MFRSALASALIAVTATAASAQSLGTFRWQTQPFCNVVTLTVIQEAGQYRLEGFDDQCGAATKAPITGTAVPNADGTIQFGFSVVSTPGGAATHLAVPINVASLGGQWRDGAGHSGAFVFNAHTGGQPRPVVTAVPLSISMSGDSGIIARGQETGTGQYPYSKSTRMMWNPGKGAFRAGGVFYGDEDDNIGLFSVGMGYSSAASGFASVALGSANASGDRAVAIGGAGAAGEHGVAIGFLASAFRKDTLALGTEASATATNAVAIGPMAHADHVGAIVMSGGGSSLYSSADFQFSLRALGGTRIFSNYNNTAGVQLAANASAWSSLSDVNSKEHFRDLDGGDVLARIARMPIREWSYKAQDAAIRHVGPTAQDFHAAFGLGEDRLRISTIDADGIALAAIQALEARTRADRDALVRENADLRAALAALQARLEALEPRPR